MLDRLLHHGGGQDRVIEDLPPIEEALVAGDDEAGLRTVGGRQPSSSMVGNSGQVMAE